MPKNPEPLAPESLSWAAVAAAAPDLSAAVEKRFAAFTHHTLATLRRDGSPRTSGIEVQFLGGELAMGMMPGSMKARDLIRDPRFALQANPGGGTDMGGGDVRISGRAVEIHDPEVIAAYVTVIRPPEPFHLFHTEVTEIVRASVEDETYLVVETWSPGSGVRRQRRT